MHVQTRIVHFFEYTFEMIALNENETMKTPNKCFTVVY